MACIVRYLRVTPFSFMWAHLAAEITLIVWGEMKSSSKIALISFLEILSKAV